MNWFIVNRSRVFLRSSLCVTPIVFMAAALLTAPLVRWVDDRTQWTLMGFEPDGARALVGALASSLLTFIVFAFSMILLMVQIAGGQLSPRVIARIFEGRTAKLTLGAFAFSFTYSLAAMGRIEGRVPQLPVMLVILSSLASLALFLYLIQRVSQTLRPIQIMTQVAADTRAAIDKAYPDPFTAPPEAAPGPDVPTVPADRTVTYRGCPGAVLAVDTAGLAEIARKAGCTLELVPRMGDFLADGDDLFGLRGARSGEVDENRLRRGVVTGTERSQENDPVFGFRILVEIAVKALSPSLNDPSTGVLALDQLQHLLRRLGGRDLDTGLVRDSAGAVRLRFRTPAWEDYLALAVTEIRHYGADSHQVARRLRAMFDHLLAVLPAERREALHRERALLQRTTEGALADPEDRRLAGVGDRQGFGSLLRGGGPEDAPNGR
ncbi:MAG: DUF2254 domain-containing protein [Acidobacteria bacterium]|nr:DUF2254 domain-containing protein [Acidobacteriota bacterium]